MNRAPRGNHSRQPGNHAARYARTSCTGPSASSAGGLWWQPSEDAGARFEASFASQPAPAVVLRLADSRFARVNPGFLALCGYAAGDIVGRPLRELDILRDAEHRDAAVHALGNCSSIEPQTSRVPTRDGGSRSVLLAGQPIRMAGQACMLFTCNDMTERKHSETEMVAAITALMRDSSWFGQALMEKLAEVHHAEGRPGGLASLTPREKQVLEQMCRGRCNHEIAATLQLSRNTVRNHVANLYSKIDVNNRGSAVVWGRERGLGSF